MITFHVEITPSQYQALNYQVRVEVFVKGVQFSYIEYHDMSFMESNFDLIWKSLGVKIKKAILDKS